MDVNLIYFEPLKTQIKEYLSQEQINKIQEAYVLAFQAHSGQFRSSGEPYITHPVAVATILANMKLDYEAIIAAVLHDTIEDTYVSYDDIVKQFGKHIALLVDGVSKLDKLKFRNRQEAQAENFRKMILAMVEDVRVILIKLADRTHNMRTLDSLRPDKKRRIAKETLEIYAPLAHRLGIHHIKTELETLSFEAIYPYRSEILKRVISSARNNRKALIQEILDEISNRLKQQKIEFTVQGVERSIYEIYQSMLLKEQRFHSIMDIYVFIVQVKDVDSCYRTLGCLHNLYKPKPYRFKDYIAIPKTNGYQSLHTSLIGPHGTPLEVQIRTHEMEQFAKMGIVAHWDYEHIDENTNKTAVQIKTQRWLRNLLELQQDSGNTLEFIDSVKSELFPKEIYVFTPKGKIIELSAGATPVDFAYFVHTDIGNRCVGALVDRKPYPLSKPLSNGQTVEILTSSQKIPDINWLSFVVTNKAITKIKQSLKQLKKEEATCLGKLLLNQSLPDQYSMEDISPELTESILSLTKSNSLDDLYFEIGIGNIMTQFVTGIIEHQTTKQDQDIQEVRISGKESNLIQFAKCCHPIPDDPICGQINPGTGMTVHHQKCRNVNLSNGNDAFVPLNWSEDLKESYVAEINISISQNSGEVLAFVILTINQAEANIVWLNAEENYNQNNHLFIHLEVKNNQQLDAIINEIKQHQYIVEISRNINQA